MLRRLVVLTATAAIAGCGSSSPKACSGVALASIVRVEVPKDWAQIGRPARLCVDTTCHEASAAPAADGTPFLSAVAPELDGAARSVRVVLSTESSYTGDITTHLISPGCQGAMVAAARLDPATGTLQPTTWPR